ncbi:hypothetical protein AX16_000504 [Volvariella volvacea WC 439]|nr:hypothetical protein AX16_000504 [Volvariella volvacea WC 439]
MKLTPSSSLLLATLAISSSSTVLAAPTDKQSVTTSHDDAPLQSRGETIRDVQSLTQNLQNTAGAVVKTASDLVGSVQTRRDESGEATDSDDVATTEVSQDDQQDGSSPDISSKMSASDENPPTGITDTPLPPILPSKRGDSGAEDTPTSKEDPLATSLGVSATDANPPAPIVDEPLAPASASKRDEPAVQDPSSSSQSIVDDPLPPIDQLAE